MIKEDIIKSAMVQFSFDRQKAKALVESILSIIKENLAEGENIMISGFGQFKVRQKNPRVGRNPKTKENFEISARKVVTFYPSKVFRKEINLDEK